MIFKSYEIQKKVLDFEKYNLFLLYGENVGLKKEIKESIIEKIKQKDSKTELLSFYEDDITNDNENFYNSLYSGSLFSNKKVIYINSCTDKINNQIELILEKNPQNIFLILNSEILDKKSKLRNFFEKNNKTVCVPCYLDNNKDLELITSRFLEKENIKLSRETINLLIEKANNDRNNLKNEFEKIKSFSLNKKELNFQEVKSLINFSGEYKSDNLINECLCGNIGQYKIILEELYTNTVNQIYIFRILSNKIQKLISMKEKEKNYSSIDNLINSSKPPIFWKEKPIIKKQLSIWNFNDLKNIVAEINATELLCKKNPHISKIIFFNFFTKICKKANSYS